MISRAELNKDNLPLDEIQEANLTKLLVVMNKIRAEYGMTMIVTSGVRSAADELRIDPAHPKSLHTLAAACDIYDAGPEKRLWNWCLNNTEFLIEVGTWMEDGLYTPQHCHFQIYPPQSGSRFFKP